MSALALMNAAAKMSDKPRSVSDAPSGDVVANPPKQGPLTNEQIAHVKIPEAYEGVDPAKVPFDKRAIQPPPQVVQPEQMVPGVPQTAFESALHIPTKYVGIPLAHAFFSAMGDSDKMGSTADAQQELDRENYARQQGKFLRQ